MEELFLYLKENNLTISSCESFTAGLFANRFCQISGASNYFKGGFVCYSDEFKINQLNIFDEIIKKYGVVSEQVAELMAKHCAEILKTDLSVSFTGFAPPTSDKMVGLAYCGIYFKGEITVIKINNQKINDRLQFQNFAIDQCLSALVNISKSPGKTS
jgi:nicotinamide-nucleotide amidase